MASVLILAAFLLSLDLVTLGEKVNSTKKDTTVASCSTVYACEGQSLRLSCPRAGDVIDVVRANFGRFSIAVCNEEVTTNLSVNCYALNTLKVMRQSCQMRQSCEIKSKVTAFGSDPCPETPKYLEVHYRCVKGISFTAPTSMGLVGTDPSTASPQLPQLDSRVPITAKPTPAGQPEESSTEDIFPSSTLPDISARFLSQSLTSTNIMDTSETPVILIKNHETSTTTSTTESTTTGQYDTSFTPSLKYNTIKKDSDVFDDVLITTHLDSPSLSSANFTLSCPPLLKRTLEWPRTASGQTARLPCPLGTRGQARWVCGIDGLWRTDDPDLGNCRSLWLMKLQEQLSARDPSIVRLAKEAAHYAAVNPLYGGDLAPLLAAVTAVASRAAATAEWTSEAVSELAQALVKSASLALSESNGAAWRDLPLERGDRAEAVTALAAAAAAAGMLLPAAARENQEVTVSSPNILMSVKRLNFHHMSHLRLPSAASRSTRDWSSYTDSADVPSIVLMENMERDGAEIIFAAFKNFNNILDSVIAHKRKRLNSLVAMVTMRTEHVPLLPEPVKVTFKHLSDSLEQNRECAHWEAHFFSTRGCRLLETNLTHTRCACSHFGLIALIEDEQQQVVKTSEASTTHVTLVVSVVIATIVVFCLIVSLAIGLDYCRRIRQSQMKWQRSICQKSKLPCFHDNSEGDTPRRNLYVSNTSGFSSPVADHYMEIVQRPQQAAPQSAAGTVRRKSTVLDHTHHNFSAKTPLSTPERPLLHQQHQHDLLRSPSPTSISHIYVEVSENVGGLAYHGPLFQPIQTPVIIGGEANKATATAAAGTAVRSSNSSQSSGYYSGGSPNGGRLMGWPFEGVPPPLKPRGMAPPPIRTISSGVDCGLDIQDSQII